MNLRDGKKEPGLLGPFALDTVIVGDRLDVLGQLPDGCVDLVVTDPPYGAKGRAEWDQWGGTEWVAEVARVLREGGSSYAFIGYSHAPELALAFREVLTERSWITWWKRNSALAQVLNWKSQAEFILYFVKGDGHTWNRWDTLEPFVTEGGDEGSPYLGKVPGNVWLIPGVNWCSSERVEDFPTQKPLRVIERIIKASSMENDVVADFFMGSGTTAVAAKRLGRHFFGCDNSEKHVRMARERISHTQTLLPNFELAYKKVARPQSMLPGL